MTARQSSPRNAPGAGSTKDPWCAMSFPPARTRLPSHFDASQQCRTFYLCVLVHQQFLSFFFFFYFFEPNPLCTDPSTLSSRALLLVSGERELARVESGRGPLGIETPLWPIFEQWNKDKRNKPAPLASVGRIARPPNTHLPHAHES